MGHRILVPLDGSPFAEHALAPAADIARRTGARLELATVYTSQMPAWRTSGTPVHDPRIDQERLAALRHYLDQTAGQVSHGLDVPATGVLLEGSPPDALARHIAERRPALVVMTTHGRVGLKRAWLGSVAEELMQRADAPVLVLRSNEGEPQRSFAPRRILVPLDGSERAERVIETAAWLAARDNAQFLLLRIMSRATVTPYPTVFPAGAAPDAAELSTAAEETLQLVKQRLSSRGFEVTGEVVTEREAERAILASTERGSVDLIAMVTRGFDGGRMRLGTVAEKVVRSTRTPVLLRRA
jgi:nucleotide-binding universal stress UspA family protein